MAQTHCLGSQLRSGVGTYFLQPKLDLELEIRSGGGTFFSNQNLTSLRRVISADSTPTALTMSEVCTDAETLQGLVTTFLPLLMAQIHCLGPQLRSGGGTFFFQPKLDLPQKGHNCRLLIPGIFGPVASGGDGTIRGSTRPIFKSEDLGIPSLVIPRLELDIPLDRATR